MKYVKVDADKVAQALQAVLGPTARVVQEFKGDNVDHVKITTAFGTVKLSCSQYCNHLEAWTPKVVKRWRVESTIAGMPVSNVFKTKELADTACEELERLSCAYTVTEFETTDD